MNHFIYRKKRKILLAAISMGVLAASISAFHGPEAVYAYTATAGTINDGPVKVRNAPVTGDKLTLLYPGNAVTVTDETAGSDGYTWCQIQMSDGVTGYIRSDFVTLQGTDSSAGQTNADSSAGGTNGVVQNTEKGVYVRSGAGTSYSVVTKVYKGQAVNVGELVSAGGMNWYSVTLVVGGIRPPWRSLKPLGAAIRTAPAWKTLKRRWKPIRSASRSASATPWNARWKTSPTGNPPSPRKK